MFNVRKHLRAFSLEMGSSDQNRPQAFQIFRLNHSVSKKGTVSFSRREKHCSYPKLFALWYQGQLLATFRVAEG